MKIITPEISEQVICQIRRIGCMLTNPLAVKSVDFKKPTDFVTNVDYTVQSQVRAALACLTPDIQFMGEEGPKEELDLTKPMWILDPVDGTTNLIHNYMHSAISLGLLEDGQITFAVVYDPYTSECFTARRGHGAFCNGRPVKVSEREDISSSLVTVGTAPAWREFADETFGDMRKIYDKCQDVRRSGCASLDLCSVASGRTEGFLELYLLPWDYAAGTLILEEAGGRVTTPEGGPVRFDKGCGILATNGLIHEQLMDIIKD